MKKNSVFMVIVLYKTRLEESLSYQSIHKYIEHLSVPYSILLYNNSPEIAIQTNCANEYVVNASDNNMLAGAYNYALSLAVKEKRDWLLLLDQDTELTADYFKKLNQFLASEFATSYSIVVPMLVEGDIRLSPLSYSSQLGPFWQSHYQSVTFENQQLYQDKCVVAFNSVSLLLVDALKAIGGFDFQYPLDMLDYAYYYQLYKKKARFYILDTIIQQHLSILDKEHPMSLARHKSYLEANLRFAHSLGWKAVLSQKTHLLLSIGKQFLSKGRYDYCKIGMRNLFKI